MNNKAWMYFGFNGRINRKQYLINWLLPYGLIVMMATQASEYLFLEEYYKQEAFMKWFYLLSLAPYFAVLVKRFHDFNKSGSLAFWGYVVFLPILASIIKFVLIYSLSDAGDAGGLRRIDLDEEPLHPLDRIGFSHKNLIFVIEILFLLAWYGIPALIPGTKGENKYGEPV